MKTKTKTTEKKAAKGREHTIAKSMPPRREKKAERIASADDLDAQRTRHAEAAAKETPVETVIDAMGGQSLTTGARPVEKEAPAPKRAKPANAPEPKIPTPDDAEELVVFAFRLTRAERDAIHAVAGSAKASKFVRTLAVAAARRDNPAVLGILDALEAAQK
jgi:hypothetical protein